MYDKDGSGSISLDEFLALYENMYLNSNKGVSIFVNLIKRFELNLEKSDFESIFEFRKSELKFEKSVFGI